VKYLTEKNGAVIIFSSHLCHKDVADSLGLEVFSAGFVGLIDSSEPCNAVSGVHAELMCGGSSESLGISSSPSDEETILNELFSF